jgi:hypothetical protein
MSRTSSFVLAAAFALSATACSVVTQETTTTATTVVVAPSTTATSSTSTTSPTTTTLPIGTESLPLAMRQEIAELISITEQIRELQFLAPPTIVVVTGEELEVRVRESIAEDVEDVPADEALLKLLGLLDPEIDLLGLYLDLYGEQVAGYYDGEAGELVVPAGEALSPFQKATLIHELTHALTDQRFGFNDAYRKLIDEQRFDEAVAFLSVIEGDATLTEILYIQQLSVSDQQSLLQEIFGANSEVFDAAPQFLQNSLVFPYREGLAFVQRAHGIGGFDEVNRLYVEPPVSSEQIIDPRAYQRDMPIRVNTVEPAISGYDVVYRSVWGQLSFDLMFDQVLGGAPEASNGWGGDAYVQWFDGSEAALLIEFVGDSPSDAQEMADALVRYVLAGMAVGGPQDQDGGTYFEADDFAFVRIDDGRVFFVAAGDPAVGRQIVMALP